MLGTARSHEISERCRMEGKGSKGCPRRGEDPWAWRRALSPSSLPGSPTPIAQRRNGLSSQVNRPPRQQITRIPEKLLAGTMPGPCSPQEAPGLEAKSRNCQNPTLVILMIHRYKNTKRVRDGMYCSPFDPGGNSVKCWRKMLKRTYIKK